MREPCTIHNKTTKLAVLFALVGAMMIVVPMLIEQAYARTVGYVQSRSIFSDPHFTNVIGKLTAGKWIHLPRLLGTGWGIEWETAGSGVFGGNEKGTVEADFGGRHVIFSFSNPSKGANTCSIENTGTLTHKTCTITQHSGLYDPAKAKYVVSTIRLH
jgi:hypothetical protein